MKKINVHACRQVGFTLFELLVSISIIGILMAVASVSYSSAQKKARDARRMEDMTSIQKAAEVYYSQNAYAYPANTGAFTSGANPVLQSWPSDPKGVGWTAYTYQIGGTYCACAAMDNLTGGNAADNNCTFASGPYYCVKSQQ